MTANVGIGMRLEAADKEIERLLQKSRDDDDEIMALKTALKSLHPRSVSERQEECTCGMPRRAIVPEEHDETCPVVRSHLAPTQEKPDG